VAFVSRWRGRYHRRFVAGSCPAARRRQWAWQSFPLRRRQFHQYRAVAADPTGIRRPDAFAHRGAAASGHARSKTARSRHRTQTESEAGPFLESTFGSNRFACEQNNWCDPSRPATTLRIAARCSNLTRIHFKSAAAELPVFAKQTRGRFHRRVRRGGAFRRTFRLSGPLSRHGPWYVE
jgi:hypothetical protein